LEWQTETSFCTIRIRGKQWYWVYKVSLNNKSSLSGCDFNVGRGSLTQTNQTKGDFFFFKKKFLKKVRFLNFKENKNFFIFNKKTNYDSSYFFIKKPNLLFFNNKLNGGSFFFTKTYTSSLKKFNRGFLVIQQQPKTEFNFSYNISFFKKKIFFFKNINEFFKNSVFVKNRLISVDNILYLPARKNITIITNSFDVAHS
jgi:heme/copper-type cytochrome/quinol oxidase subunit 2